MSPIFRMLWAIRLLGCLVLTLAVACSASESTPNQGNNARGDSTTTDQDNSTDDDGDSDNSSDDDNTTDGDEMGGDTDGSVFTWSGSFNTAEMFANASHNQQDGELDCQIGNSGLLLVVQGTSELEDCRTADIKDRVTLRVPGYSAGQSTDYSASFVGEYVAVVSITGPAHGPGCANYSGSSWETCEIEGIVTGTHHALQVSCTNYGSGSTTFNGTATFDSNDCEGVETAFAACQGGAQDCSEVAQSVCEAYSEGCVAGISCRPYGAECYEIEVGEVCSSKVGCDWNGDNCTASEAINTCPLSTSISECYSGGCIGEALCEGTQTCAGQDEVACAGLPACTMSWAN